MLKYNLNGRDVSKEKLQEYVNDKSNIICSIDMTLERKNKVKLLPLSHEGIELEKSFLGGWSKEMEKIGANFGAIKLGGCSHLMGKDLWIIMFNEGSFSWWEKLLFKIFQRLLGS